MHSVNSREFTPKETHVFDENIANWKARISVTVPPVCSSLVDDASMQLHHSNANRNLNKT